VPIYELKVTGKEKPRMIKAKDVSEALVFAKVAEIKPVGAERMIELQEQGIALEKVPDPRDPSSYAPGGALHGQTPPAGVTVPEVKAEGDDKGKADKA
jgi:hypothetical protein